jgi:hypothetical protein
MPRQAPKVIAGMRSGRDTRMESMAEMERKEHNPELSQVVGLDPKKGTIYISKFPSYRVQITSPGDTINPVTGQRTRNRGIVAVFKQGRYQNTEKDKRTREMVDKTLQENSRFGTPGKADYWLASAQTEMIREQKLISARKTLEELPQEVKDDFIASLGKGGGEDHDLTA